MRSQLEWLDHDVKMCRDLIEQSPRISPLIADTSDLRVHNHRLTVADLFFRALDNAAGTGCLVAQRLLPPSLSVQRALLEACVNLAFLQRIPDPVLGALEFRAYSLLKWIDMFPDETAGVLERRAILSGMPADVVANAERRVKGKNSWSGKPFRQMAEHLDLTATELYSLLSEDAHGRLLGEHARLEMSSPTKGQVRLGREMRASECEWAANFARRMLLWSFAAFWHVFERDLPDLPTSDPHQWMLTQDSQGVLPNPAYDAKAEGDAQPT
jgi:hypothetical protein